MTTTTTLVHRGSPGPSAWWHQALVYEMASPQLGALELPAVAAMLDHVVSLGLDALLIRPSLMEATEDVAAFRSLAEHAHSLGLRVIVRVSGALGPVTGPHAGADERVFVQAEGPGQVLLSRAESFLAAGADGVDVGTILPPELTANTDLDLLTQYFSVLHTHVASYCADGVLGADVSTDYPDAMRHHLQEDWLHHLRDDSLVLTRWDAQSLTDHLTASLADHDRFGATPVWRILPPYRVREETDPGDGRRWFEQAAPVRQRRAIALQALALALPGAVYLRQGDEIAMMDADKPVNPLELARIVNERAATQGSQFGSPLATVRHATFLRRSRELSTAPLAFVRGLPWCPPGVLSLLVRDVLVLVNTLPEPVALPEHAEVLLASQHLDQRDGRLLVPAATTTWLEASTVA